MPHAAHTLLGGLTGRGVYHDQGPANFPRIGHHLRRSSLAPGRQAIPEGDEHIAAIHGLETGVQVGLGPLLGRGDLENSLGPRQSALDPLPFLGAEILLKFMAGKW